MNRSLYALCLLASFGLLGCGGSPPRPLAASPNEAHIEALVQEKCTTCHKAPKGASLARSDAQASVEKHKKKLKLEDHDWSGVVERLAKD